MNLRYRTCGGEKYGWMIRRGSDTFDSDQAAVKEPSGGIAHRDKRDDLVATLRISRRNYVDAGRALTARRPPRGKAMVYRDDRGSSITNEDWAKIETGSTIRTSLSGTRRAELIRSSNKLFFFPLRGAIFSQANREAAMKAD